ncbi:aminopeptidase [Erysipelotrichaceae bacterium OttesenSCG-928-M19]|nr:aminopeptidase [Erysipelotrichaceae bacterium OttesenSCG-928-M19]
MFDKRINDLAFQLVDYSIDVQEGEIIRIVAHDFASKPLVKELVKEITKKKAIASVEFVDGEVQALEYLNSTKKAREYKAKWELEKTKDMDALISIRGKSNDYELKNVSQDIIAEIMAANKEAQNIRVNQRKWVLLNYPTNYYANSAKMGYDDYQDFFYDVMLVDYAKMYQDAKPLKALMDKTDKVRIVGNGSDLTFSIKDIPAIICAGERNVPDGEVYSAPIKDSVNGVVQYNTISSIQGVEFKNVKLTIENGKIIEASSEINNDKINDIFNSDEGARYFGEFAIGINPKINHPVGDILFDEKIYGSFHLTPGQAYDEADNGNSSIIHWDLVCIQTPEYGGGEIYFDDVLIRKDGEFMIAELKNLNK